MKLEGIPFQTIDWSRIAPTQHPGDPGVAIWRTLEIGNVRVRKVEYSPGYVADHWCARGHVILVLEGELVTELRAIPEYVRLFDEAFDGKDGSALTFDNTTRAIAEASSRG